MELEHQIQTSGAKALFTCAPLLGNALKAAEKAKIPRDKIFLLEMPDVDEKKIGLITVSDLISEGRLLPELEPLRWVKGQGARQVAYLCYSSGTSGLPVS
jgi:acyl-CoA synthetase (AMP-forming)/AMP-acid ligase II